MVVDIVLGDIFTSIFLFMWIKPWLQAWGHLVSNTLVVLDLLLQQRLFAEKLIPDLDNFKLLGILSFLMMRTLRIIADISIHYYGMDLKEIMAFLQKYLPMPKESIESELYRYVSLPGQAICYKLGDEILRRMFINNFERTDKLLDDDAISFYDKLIRGGLMPLEILCNKHNVSYKF